MIRAVRDRHAALLKELRQDQQQVRQIARPEPAKKVESVKTPEPMKRPAQQSERPSFEERLERLREGPKPTRSRDRDLDRGR